MAFVWINQYNLLKIGYPLEGNKRAELLSAPVVKAGRSNKISEVRVRLENGDKVTLPVHAICGMEAEIPEFGTLAVFFDQPKKWNYNAPLRSPGQKVSTDCSDAVPRPDCSS